MTQGKAQLEAELMALEQEISEKQKRLTELKKQYGHETVSDYTLQGADGDVQLSALFGDKTDLIVIHNMGRSCSYCTLWADGFNGVINYLEDRAAFVVISPDTPDVQQAFAQERGWRFKMASSEGSTFTDDLGFLVEGGVMPGASTFSKQPDGTIVRVSKTYLGPGDPYCGVWHLFDLLADGANAWQPAFQ